MPTRVAREKEGVTGKRPHAHCSLSSSDRSSRRSVILSCMHGIRANSNCPWNGDLRLGFHSSKGMSTCTQRATDRYVARFVSLPLKSLILCFCTTIRSTSNSALCKTGRLHAVNPAVIHRFSLCGNHYHEWSPASGFAATRTQTLTQKLWPFLHEGIAAVGHDF